MTGNLVLDLAISLAAVAVLVLISWLLGAGKVDRLSRSDVEKRVRFDEPDFVFDRYIEGADGRSSVLIGANEVVVALRSGDRITTRRLAKEAIRASVDNRAVKLQTNDFTTPSIRLMAGDGAEASEWQQLLSGD
ncbi:MAG: hypothetical protein AAF668_11135 [Pseudomonadota bacterium]